MTREEETKKASFEAYPENIGYSTISDQLYDYNALDRKIWVSGAEWADEHPKQITLSAADRGIIDEIIFALNSLGKEKMISYHKEIEFLNKIRKS